MAEFKYQKIKFKLFGADKKIRLFRQMQRMIKAKQAIPKIFETLYNQNSQNGKKPKDPIAIMLKDWQRRYASGKTMAYAMRGWISPSEEKIVEASEDKNQLAKGLQDALDASIATKKIKATVRNALTYPTLMLSVMIGMFYGFSTKIVPVFAQAVDPAQWTGLARAMYDIGNFLQNYLLIMIAILAILIAMVVYSLPRMTGPARVYLEKFPPYSLYKVTTGAAFMMSLRGFIAADVRMPDALRRISKGSTPYMKHRVDAILRNLGAGKNLGRAMMLTKHNFPDPEINNEIEVYSGIDGFAENLDLLAREWIEDTIERTKQATRILTVISLFLLAGGVIFMAASMFSLQDIIARSTGV